MGRIISFKDISKHFGDVVALDHVDLTVEAGEFLSLLGPSGCGKSTLLRICAGLETPTSGLFYLEENDMTDVPPHRRPVNMVFQNWALFPHMTVAENIGFGPAIKKIPRPEIVQRVEAVLDLVKMKGYEDRYPHQLSGGQAQRIALGRALVMEPKVLLLDEPLGSLDLKLRQEMQFELINIHKKLKTTFIYVTHDQDEALTMSDRLIVMKAGRIVQDGSPAEIYQNPNCVFSSQFIGESILFPGRIDAIDGKQCSVKNGDLLIHCALKTGLTIGQDVSVCIRPERLHIGCTPDEPWDNLLEGHVVNTIFKGPMVLYQLRVGSGRMITVQQNAGRRHSLHQPDSIVKIAWSSEDCIVLTE